MCGENAKMAVCEAYNKRDPGEDKFISDDQESDLCWLGIHLRIVLQTDIFVKGSCTSQFFAQVL